MEIELEIEGVPDRVIADAIRKKVHALRRQLTAPGQTRISISPSETRGEWDLGIRTSSGLKLVSFKAPVAELPTFIDRTLRERLGP